MLSVKKNLLRLAHFDRLIVLAKILYRGETMLQIARRAALIGLGGLAGWLAKEQLTPQLPVLDGNALQVSPPIEGMLNDASGLSATQIHKHIILKEDRGEALLGAIRKELDQAKTDKRPLNVGAARHSMGGQAIPRHGTALTFDNAGIEIDSKAETYLAHGGARWWQIIAALDPLGFSPKVMQSNSDFGLAATFSVNAHGWPVPYGPMGSTVRSLRMVLPSGELVTCSPTENAALFNHAMGGYGLIGVILDLEVEMVRNKRLEPHFKRLPAVAFADEFDKAVKDPAVLMAYGRLNVERARFFEHALLVTFRAAQDQSRLPKNPTGMLQQHRFSDSITLNETKRRVYRAQTGNEWVKRARWWLETTLAPTLPSGDITRNLLMNDPVAALSAQDPTRTDILHEYFVPFDRFEEFVDLCSEVIPSSHQELLNITLRYVVQDSQSTLSFARAPRIAAVMSFSQELTTRADADMARMTETLIDRVLAIGGSYYLPYRPHARLDQLTAAYERAAFFAEEKRKLDPHLVLRNNLWDQYLAKL
jgi:FAD/FMN-containing dehydrogenase